MPHNILLFDTPEARLNLMPLTLTRPIGAIRTGIWTVEEKYVRYFEAKTAFLTKPYLQELFTKAAFNFQEAILVNATILPTPHFYKAIQELAPGEKLVQGLETLAAKPLQPIESYDNLHGVLMELSTVEYALELNMLKRPTDVFSLNGEAIKTDFSYLNPADNQGVQDAYTVCYASENIFVEAGANIKAAVLNAEAGPIYIGKNTEIQEGSLIKGPFALCENSVVNMGGKMRGDTTIGPGCKVGGEISNSVFLGYSNKGHDGFLGNSVIGEWCNLGADTNVSNLKNTYSQVKIYSYASQAMESTGLQFCGLIMGDQSKCGINTMFNTGTVMGVGVNIYGAGFPEKFLPSFSWGGADSSYARYKLSELLKTAERMMARRKLQMSAAYAEMLQHIYKKDDSAELA